MDKNIQLADALNKMYSYIKDGGDFAMASEDAEIASIKKFIDENYAELNVGILGFLVNIMQKNPEFDFMFVPSETGVAMEYSYKVSERVDFNEKGAIINKTNLAENTKE